MKYKLEIDELKSVETLTVNGKIYKRELINKGNGIKEYKGKDFSVALSNDGMGDNDILYKVWDVLDTEFKIFVDNIVDLCELYEMSKR